MPSPGYRSVERDVTLTTRGVSSNTAAYAGLARWGAVNQRLDVTQESDLIDKIGRPTRETSLYFHAALNYLNYANPLSFVRVQTPNMHNAFYAESVTTTGADGKAVQTAPAPILVRNRDDYDIADLKNYPIIARYPGSLANGLLVAIGGPEDYATWEYASRFSVKPAAGEVNVAVIDVNGAFTGSKGGLIEKHEQLSFVPGSKKPDGSSAYIVKVLADRSNAILVGDVAKLQDALVKAPKSFIDVTLTGGSDDTDAQKADFLSALNIMRSRETFEKARIFCSGWPDVAIKEAAAICESHEDSKAFFGPHLDHILANRDGQRQVKLYIDTTINLNTSYVFVVDNWKLVYDKYNDTDLWIPCDSDAAGLEAETHAKFDPWTSFSGTSRGKLKNALKLAWYPDAPVRDDLYNSNINPIVSFKGTGIVLFGDKTGLRSTSGFSHANVRNLFIAMKAAIGADARDLLFEINDVFSRSSFRTRTDAYLDGVQSRRGVSDKLVVCDETNNPASVVDANEFVGTIYVKPTRVINNITLNFVAVGTSVSFSEIEG